MNRAIALLAGIACGFRRRGLRLFMILLVVNLTIAPFTLTSAKAMTIDEVATAIDKINQYSGNSLPFSGAQLLAYRDMITSCSQSSSADDVLACVDAIASSDAGKEADIPSWVPEMLNVYFDIEHKDYWGLLEDAGEAVACAAAQVLAFGVDVCGAIEALVDAAKDIASAAAAIGAFFADLGSDLKDIGQDIYCWFASCDDSPPPPPPAAVAYQNFYFPLIPFGLQQRLQSRDTWIKFAGDPSTTQQGSIIGQGTKAGYLPKPLADALPAYRAAVYAQWDSAILTQYAPAARQAGEAFATPANAQYYAQVGIQAWNSGLIDGLSGSGAIPLPLTNPGIQACQAKVLAAGGDKVDAWIMDEGPSHPKVPPGFKWPSNYQQLCQPFEKQLWADLHPLVASRAAIALQTLCQNKGGNPNVYACSMYAVQNCKNILAFTGLPNAICSNTSPNPGTSKGTYVCQPGNVIRQYVLTGPHPANCHLASVQNPPPQNSPFGSGGQR